MAYVYSTSREDIVITGISCRFAEAGDPRSFWQRILSGQSAFVPFAGEQEESVPGKPVFDRTFPDFAARLGELYACSASDQYFPREMNAGENHDLFFAVQLVCDALRDGGMQPRGLPTDRISLRLGYAPPFNTASVNWLQHTFFLEQAVGLVQKFFPGATPSQLAEIRERLCASLPDPNAYSFLSALGSMTAAWTAHLLGFAGPAFVLDAGVVSAHQALQGAMDDLSARRCDIALAGALQPPFTAAFIQGLSGTCSFSSARRLQPFGRDASGTLPGEGGAVFVLKRLKDALKSGDRIYAIVRSTGIVAASLDLRQRVPAPERLERAYRRAFRTSDVAPESVQLFEAHGSGVPHTDQVELDVLFDLLGTRAPGTPLAGIGSVKGNFGHTLWAAGAAGIAKAAIAISEKLLPPTVEVDHPYVRLLSPRSPAYLLSEVRPWLRGNKKDPRRACVAAVDFTGTCAVAVLEEYPE